MTVEANGQSTYFQKTALNGSLSASDLPLHIGLGKATMANEIKVWWPSGKETILSDVEHGQILKIVEPGE